jgi:uncharacterized protein with von Willebrand factor type A (vWA) domain
MFDRLIEFTEALRTAGVPVATTDTTDATRALREIPLGERAAVKTTLSATMIKNAAHAPVFDTLFDLYFGDPEAPTRSAAPDDTRDTEELQQSLFDALLQGDASAVGALVAEAVLGFGRLERSPDWYSNYEVTRALGLDEIAARLAGHADEQDVPELERTLLRDEFSRRVQAVRDRILSETRLRTAQQRGAAAVARYAVSPVAEELNFTSATADLAELRKAVRPLARKLATAVALKRRRATRGHVDIRKTIRRSLSSGGVPLETPMKHRTPHRPELVLLCDVSSSVARFSRFTLMLTHALRTQFQKVRAYAFINTPAEITKHLQHEDFTLAMEEIGKHAYVDTYDGRTDYGVVFKEMVESHSDAVGPKTTVLILGDARTNYRSRHTDSLKELCHRARHSFWLNPEPMGDWDIGDSAASEYAAYVDKMVEVRNLRQLREFIATEL